MWEEVRDMAYEAGDMEMYEKGVQVTSRRRRNPSNGPPNSPSCSAATNAATLSGRLIRAALDTFEDIPANVDAIMASDAYLLRRVNP